MYQPPLLKQKPYRESNTGVRRRPGVLFVCIACLGVAACDPATKPPTPQASPELAVAASPVPGVEPHTHQGAEAAAVVAKPVVASERLNLAYTPAPEDKVIPGDHRQGVAEKNMLPDMFDQQEKARNISVSGGLLTDPEKDEYLDSVNGAEVSLKVRTR